MVLVCILSLVSNLSERTPFSDLPWHALGVSACHFCPHKGSAAGQLLGQLSHKASCFKNIRSCLN